MNNTTFDRGGMTICKQQLFDTIIALYGEERCIHTISTIEYSTENLQTAIDYTLIPGSTQKKQTTVVRVKNTIATSKAPAVISISQPIYDSNILGEYVVVKLIRFHVPGQLLVEDTWKGYQKSELDQTRYGFARLQYVGDGFGRSLQYIKTHPFTNCDIIDVRKDDYIVIRNNAKAIHFAPTV
jgi:hypothetical protein